MKKIFSKKFALIAIAGIVTVTLLNLSNTNSYDEQLGQGIPVSIEGSIKPSINSTAEAHFWKEIGQAVYDAAKAVTKVTATNVSLDYTMPVRKVASTEIKMSSIN